MFKKEKIGSLLRAFGQIVGMLITLGVGGSYVPLVGELLEYLILSLDRIFFAANELIGMGLMVYSFFSNSERFENAFVGAKVKQMANVKRLTVDEYLGKVS